MSEFTQGILIALIPALIVSVITAYLTVRLSMRQFYTQRWWEKKAEAYSNVIEHLSYLQILYGEWVDDWAGLRRLGNKDKERFREIYHQTKESIAKATATGAFIISGDTATVLMKLLGELEKKYPNDVYGELERRYGLVKECIAKIKEHAKADLRIS